MHTDGQQATNPAANTDSQGEPITREEYADIIHEIEEQPEWRAIADKEMDYADGNQLDGELMRRQKELGIPPAIEDMIGPALLSIQGYEAKTRTDWRVSPNGEMGGQDVASAINFKLNQAERHSKADRAFSAAFRPQIGCGIGWVEVGKEQDAFRYPYRCNSVHRNEIHWDMKNTDGIDPSMPECRWLRRQRWLLPERVAQRFPDKRAAIMGAGRNGGSWFDINPIEGGGGTSLNNGWGQGRPWTWMEDRWFNSTNREVCLAELWYRRWVSVLVLRMPDGRVVEFNRANPAHSVALAIGHARAEKSIVSRMRRAYWLGPIMLHDGPTPHPHQHYPYVPLFGFREDMTGTPYGYVRSMKYPQDSLNSGQSKLRWGMSVVRVERTKGATEMTDAQLRRQIARPDADIVLSAAHMAQPGARFDVKRDYTLTEQHFQLLQDNRLSIERVSMITSGFQGRQGTARSGVQEQTQVEQSNQSLGHIMDNARAGRTQIGELLMAHIIHDIGKEKTSVVIEGDALQPDREVVLNEPTVDEFGQPYVSNDVLRTRLKVALDDVPSTNSYRGQQLAAMSESIKSLPQQYQAVAMPFLASLMDVPFKRELIEALRAANEQMTPEQIEQRVAEAVKDALAKAGIEIKQRELDLKAAKNEAEIEKIVAQAVQVGVQSAFSAMQAGAQVAMNPAIAPVADAIMQGAGYRLPSPRGDDPNFPTAAAAAAPVQPGAVPAVRENTSPVFPPVPSDGASPMQGIETAAQGDNLPA